MTTQMVLCDLVGVTPLLVNRFHEDAQAEATRGVHSRSEAPTPQEDAHGRLHEAEGVPYWPAEPVRQAIIAAAARFKIGRRSAAGDMAATLYVAPAALQLVGEWHVDSRPVVIPATRGRVLRHRPMFDEWRLVAVELHFDPDLVDRRLLRQCVDGAGTYVGTGDFRPQKRGPYGRFSVARWE